MQKMDGHQGNQFIEDYKTKQYHDPSFSVVYNSPHRSASQFRSVLPYGMDALIWKQSDLRIELIGSIRLM